MGYIVISYIVIADTNDEMSGSTPSITLVVQYIIQTEPIYLVSGLIPQIIEERAKHHEHISSTDTPLRTGFPIYH